MKTLQDLPPTLKETYSSYIEELKFYSIINLNSLVRLSSTYWCGHT